MEIFQIDVDVFVVEFSEFDSSYIRNITYNKYSGIMEVVAKTGKFLFTVPYQTFFDFIDSESKGKFFNSLLHNKKQTTMSDLTLNGSIDLSKINKDGLIYGKVKEDGTRPIYLNFQLNYREAEDKFGQNGFVSQIFNKEVRKANPGIQGKILGNVKDFTAYERQQLPKVGEEAGTVGDPEEGASDDLPF